VASAGRSFSSVGNLAWGRTSEFKYCFHSGVPRTPHPPAICIVVKTKDLQMGQFVFV